MEMLLQRTKDSLGLFQRNCGLLVFRQIIWSEKAGIDRHGGVALGILQGDPLSPTLFLLFILDLLFTDDPSDICLIDTLISHLEHADDLVLFATQAKALQDKLNTLARWARDNGMTINPTKSAILVFSSAPPPAATFFLGNTALETKSEYKYLGFTIKVAPGVPILDSNYLALSNSAASSGIVLFTMRAMVGKLRPKECLSLYYALVDSHLCFGADFMIDTKSNLLKLLQDTQQSFLRRVLCLGDYSIIAILFSETGVWPIKYRRLHLALRYAAYLIQLPHERLAWKAWAESVEMHTAFTKKHTKFQSGWTHDLSIAFPSASLPPRYADWSLQTIDIMQDLLKTELLEYIRSNSSVNRTPSIALRPLPYASSLKRRAYLDIPCQNHRICLTRILCASHNFAVEALRRVKLRDNVYIERQYRLCRLCGGFSGAIEDIHHALFTCKGHLRLITLRNDFFSNLPGANDVVIPEVSDDNAWARLICTWADDLPSAIPLARLAWHVSRLFYAHDLLIPSIPSAPLTTPLLEASVRDRSSIEPTPFFEAPPIDMDPNSDYSSEDEDEDVTMLIG